MIKTYGVKGYMEWTALIKVGRANFQVPFTGGTKQGYGMAPATYTCREKVFQKVLENSDYFKSGKIFLVSQVGEEEDNPTEKEGKGTKESGKKQGEGEPATPTTPVPENPGEPEPAAKTEMPEKKADAAETVTTVKVTDRAEAKQYLMDTFGLSAGSLRTRSEIERVGRAHGVVFEGLE